MENGHHGELGQNARVIVKNLEFDPVPTQHPKMEGKTVCRLTLTHPVAVKTIAVKTN